MLTALQEVKFDSITKRIRNLCQGLDPKYIDPVPVTQKVVEGFYNGISTAEVDTLAAETCAYMSQKHPDFSTLAARIAVSNLHKCLGRALRWSEAHLGVARNVRCFQVVCDKHTHTPYGAMSGRSPQSSLRVGLPGCRRKKGSVLGRFALRAMCVGFGPRNTSDSFAETCRLLYTYVDLQGRPAALLSQEMWTFVEANAEKLDATIDYKRDLGYDYFGFKTLEKSYLLRVHGKIVERPQHMIMRAACGIHCGDLESALETYDMMSKNFFTHASPTLFNAGTPRPQMSSCFLLKMKDDSIEGIYDTLKQCAMISKSAGGIGVAVSNIRASGSYVRGTNGKSNGLVPMLRNFNETARYVDQGGGKRKGAFAMYLEPWHADVFDFIELRKNHGKEEQRARDLFFGLWVPDLFMQRVKDNQDWTLFCPNEAFDQETGKGLMDVWGEDFEKMYTRLEAEGKGRKTIKAQTLWFRILEAQMETGTPYMLYKDQANRKSNQQNLGTIHCSNLCTEIIEYTSADEVAVCNLASIALPSFASDSQPYDFQKLYEVTKVVTRNLNKAWQACDVRLGCGAVGGPFGHVSQVIDRNYYPVVEARRSNMRHRPVGRAQSELSMLVFSRTVQIFLFFCAVRQRGFVSGLGVQGFADALLMMTLGIHLSACCVRMRFVSHAASGLNPVRREMSSSAPGSCPLRARRPSNSTRRAAEEYMSCSSGE